MSNPTPTEPTDHFPGATEMVATPAEGEVHLLAAWMYRLADERTRNRRRGIRPHPSALTRTGAVIQQQAAVIQQQAAELAMLRQQAAPVPVSERLPDTSDPSECRMPFGDCWWFDPYQDGAWYMDTYQSRYTHWLPAHLLPLPSCEAING